MAGQVSGRGVARAARAAILAWFDQPGREIAFRGRHDPYGVLVAEVMAQQTQVSRADEAWRAWMRRFPTVEALAAAPTSDVIRQWAGLGYNRRAVSLQRAARLIVERHGGRVPDGLAELQALPGVGPYTARAVAATAFGRPVGAVDTNVRRVLGRVAGGGVDALSDRELQALADRVVPPDRAGAWTHALMDLGATVCRPRAPRCAECPVLAWCRFARRGASVGEATGSAARRASTARAFAGGPFPSTSRWLRGRIVERMREAGGWLAFDEPIGSHAVPAVHAAIHALAKDGLAEVDATGPGIRARLPAA